MMRIIPIGPKITPTRHAVVFMALLVSATLTAQVNAAEQGEAVSVPSTSEQVEGPEGTVKRSLLRRAMGGTLRGIQRTGRTLKQGTDLMGDKMRTFTQEEGLPPQQPTAHPVLQKEQTSPSPQLPSASESAPSPTPFAPPRDTGHPLSSDNAPAPPEEKRGLRRLLSSPQEMVSAMRTGAQEGMRGRRQGPAGPIEVKRINGDHGQTTVREDDRGLTLKGRLGLKPKRPRP